jgi:hypothetical protein
MNRYEKSITMLQSALNMIHKDCPEHAECLVEIARCKRLLAVNKKHLRGQWRQDAVEVDEVSLGNMSVDQGKDRTDQLADKALDGEVADLLVDYKEEAVRAFVNILEFGKAAAKPAEETAPPAKGKGQPEVEEKEERAPVGVFFDQLLQKVGSNRLDNILATFSIEYAESRGNLNKEQAFFFLALYQYALSR